MLKQSVEFFQQLKAFLKASPKLPQYREIRICRVFFANWLRIGSISPNQIIFQIWELQLKVHPQKFFLCDQRHFYYVANSEVAWYEFIPQNSSSWGNLDTKTSIWCHNSSNNAGRDRWKWTRHFFETRRAFWEFWWRFLAVWTAIMGKISPNQLYFDKV